MGKAKTRHNRTSKKGKVFPTGKGGVKKKYECKHTDGWILKEEIVISTKWENDNNIAEFECNHLDCGAKKKFKFDIDNIKESD